MPRPSPSRRHVVSSDRVEHFAAPVERVWAAIGAVDRYRSWWPWLRRLDAAGLVERDVWQCRIHTPLNVHLVFTIAIERVEPSRLVVARLDGDLVGTARIDVEPDGDGASVRLRSDLEPRQRLVRTLTWCLPPVARAAHDRVITKAVRQFSAGALSAG